MKLRNIGPLFALCGLFGACSTNNNGKVTDAGPNVVTDGGPSTGGLGFKPSNIDLSAFDLSQIGDVVLSGTNCIIDSEEPEGLVAMLCDKEFTNKVAHKIVTLPDQTRLSIFVMKSLRIEASTILAINRGHLPVVLVATKTMELLGSIDVGPGTTGGPFNGAKQVKGAGPGGGTAGDATGLAAGGGSYCGRGGKAGTQTASAGNAPGAPTPGYGTAEIVPLLAGSAGGNGALNNDVGSGGGALQLVAGTSFALHAGAGINVGGGGGAFGGLGKDGAGGGGSGGALLIESLAVTIDGDVGANGGGGGQGNGDSGDPGHAGQVALGGHKPDKGGPGGNGSFATTVDGSEGPSSTDPVLSASAGGGGAGRIRINTQVGAAKITGTVSPAGGTPCFSEGKLAP